VLVNPLTFRTINFNRSNICTATLTFAGRSHDNELCFQIESSLPMYMDAFDIVLVGEESLDLVNSLLRKVITTD